MILHYINIWKHCKTKLTMGLFEHKRILQFLSPTFKSENSVKSTWSYHGLQLNSVRLKAWYWNLVFMKRFKLNDIVEKSTKRQNEVYYGCRNYRNKPTALVLKWTEQLLEKGNHTFSQFFLQQTQTYIMKISLKFNSTWKFILHAFIMTSKEILKYSNQSQVSLTIFGPMKTQN